MRKSPEEHTLCYGHVLSVWVQPAAGKQRLEYVGAVCVFFPYSGRFGVSSIPASFEFSWGRAGRKEGWEEGSAVKWLAEIVSLYFIDSHSLLKFKFIEQILLWNEQCTRPCSQQCTKMDSLYSPVHSGSYTTFLFLLLSNEGRKNWELGLFKVTELYRGRAELRTQAWSPCPSWLSYTVVHSLTV